MKKILLFALLPLFFGCTAKEISGSFPKPVPHIKLIDFSWSWPDAAYYAKNLKTLENTPLDGVGIGITGKPRKIDGKMVKPSSYLMMGKIAWTYDDFKESVELLKSVKSTKLTDNFLRTSVRPGDADWFSDKDWNAVVSNYALIARIARETGMVGIGVDIEEYGRKFWKYYDIADRECTLEEARALVRKRGQEWGRAVFKEFPNVKMFWFYAFSYGGDKASLVAPFLDGILDVMPLTATLIEGWEMAGYKARPTTDYDRIYTDVHHRFKERMAESSREKYAKVISCAPAFYMDAIFNGKPGNQYHDALRPDIDAGRLAFFKRNLAAAIPCSDEYIWTWSERGCWWENSRNKKTKSWESICPGVNQAADILLHKKQIKSTGKNLLDAKKWVFWQQESAVPKNSPKLGRGENQEGVLTFIGLGINGCYSQNIPVKPGESYLMSVKFRSKPNFGGVANFGFAYKDQYAKWMTPRTYCRILPEGKEGWQSWQQLIHIPDGAASASVQAGAAALKKNESVQFKDITVVKLEKLEVQKDKE